MTPKDIVDLLFRSATKERIDKAKGLAARSKIDWARVLEAMTDEQRQQVEQA